MIETELRSRAPPSQQKALPWLAASTIAPLAPEAIAVLSSAGDMLGFLFRSARRFGAAFSFEIRRNSSISRAAKNSVSYWKC
jgi:hypothetical protein